MVSLPVVDSQKKSDCSSGGCSSGGCGERTPHSKKQSVVQTNVPFAERMVNLDATPTTGSYVSCIDLDLTVECNLRCTYCFKEKWNEHMEDSVAFDAMVWLLHASGPLKEVSVNFMGGEPLLRFMLIKKLVPFAKRRAMQIGKTIHFGITTNGTLIRQEVIEFWEKWGMGWHTSIDGTPEIQDLNRPTTGGKGSARLVEKAVPQILNSRPQTMARSTVVPDSAGGLVESYHYFRKLGYQQIAFVPGGPSFWDSHSIALYDQQYNELGDLYMDELRAGNFVALKGIEEAVQGIVRDQRYMHSCGAGRGLLLVDIHGDIWPCHRWNKDRYDDWRIGNIYQQFDELSRRELDIEDQTAMLQQDCPSCPANKFCSGGCPAENLEETGYVYKRHDHACELTRVWARVGKRVHDQMVEEGNPLFMTTFYSNSP